MPAPTIAPATREQVIAHLTERFAQDQLSLDEFEHRVAAVYRAATPEALAALVADLPAPAPTVPPGPSVPARIAAVLCNVERGGFVTVPAQLAKASRPGTRRPAWCESPAGSRSAPSR